MAEVTSKDVLEKLKTVRGPDMEGNIVDLGLVSDVFISDGKAYFSITVPAERAKELEPLRQAAERAVKDMPGMKGAFAALTADKKAASGQAPVSRPQAGPVQGHGHAHPHPPRPAGAPAPKPGIPGVKHIIAVASGKGGVGKSTTSVNIALALQSLGLKTAILDADIYGPSVPRLLGVSGRPQQIDGKIIKPMENYGLKAMSMGFLVDEDVAMIWRGPMIQSALLQMLREVAWGDLDVLVVDMPPGTGDAQLTMAQQVPLSGAVIVSTPQDLALIDARKAVTMFKKVEIPLLGLVENMSHFICPSCGTSHDIFGHGGARAEAEKIGVPFLGEIPLAMTIRENSDSGTPVMVSAADGPHAKVYREIATKIADQLFADGKAVRTAPEIIFE
ncbi:iron-sulfur cluster carrier protein ApbC [Rhizobium sp. KVB221]|uniref:Iron-sulfur cluster carrier protein n=1 Tax=Rhizobium setariae TaxID=2801340 RepID=A0A936YJI2_9HYPH|nr:iron-sulfur cluster carrier protein ApbC [Rhizobium setariae]MBL0370743.1 iron-sulfur cluster carrier protein ApbC [Rhizobium setariae]